MRGRSQLALSHARLTQWRAQHGGRGIPVPEELWAEVVKVARVEGCGNQISAALQPHTSSQIAQLIETAPASRRQIRNCTHLRQAVRRRMIAGRAVTNAFLVQMPGRRIASRLAHAKAGEITRSK